MRRHQEGELLSPGRQGSAQWGTKALASTMSLSHPPAEIPKGTSFHHRTCLHPQMPNVVLLWIHLSDWPASLLVLQGPSHREPLTAKCTKPAPPAPVHLVDPPQLIRQIPLKPGNVQVAQTGAPHSTVSPAPGRGEEKVHTSLTVAPAVGWGQTSGLTVVLPTNASYSRQHRGSAP